MTTSTAPVLPKLSASGGLDQVDHDPRGNAFDQTYFKDRDTGKFYQQVKDGEWVEVPLDESGLPMFQLVLPQRRGEE